MIMSNKNNNQINIPQAREAMDKFKMQAASEVEDNIVIFQRKGAQEFLRFFEAVTDLRRIGSVGFCVGLV